MLIPLLFALIIGLAIALIFKVPYLSLGRLGRCVLQFLHVNIRFPELLDRDEAHVNVIDRLLPGVQLLDSRRLVVPVVVNRVSGSVADGQLNVVLSTRQEREPAIRTVDIYVHWLVNIQQFFTLLHRSSVGDFIANLLQYQSDASSSFCEKSERQTVEIPRRGETEVAVTFEQGLLDKLGPPTRSRFPLVVVVRFPAAASTSASSNSERSVGSNVQLLAVVHIVHIRDSECSLETQVLRSFLKYSNNQVIELKRLFVANDSTTLSNGNSNSSANGTAIKNRAQQDAKFAYDGIQNDSQGDASCALPSGTSRSICVICSENDAEQICLPCRHFCLCSACCVQLTRTTSANRSLAFSNCPLCRARVTHFLNTSTSVY